MTGPPPRRSSRAYLSESGLLEGATGVAWGGRTTCRQLVEGNADYWANPDNPDEVTVLFGTPGLCNDHRDLVRSSEVAQDEAERSCALVPLTE